MPTDVLTVPLGAPIRPELPDGVRLHPLDAGDADALAAVYLESYPPGVAASDLADARREMAATFRGEYGTVRTDASVSAWHEATLVGAIMVVDHSIWDAWLAGPFIIDLFVSPAHRGLAIGRALVTHAIGACTDAGDPTLSLRFGVGTSAAAMAIYRELGFLPRQG